MPSEFEQGLMIGLLIGEGHFGGDGRQPQVTLRMHVRHEALMRWVERAFPGGRVYGPYHHDGRHYLQWMARGAYLREHLVPFLERSLSPVLDEHSWSRFDKMRDTYARQLGEPPAVADRLSSPALGPGEPGGSEERQKKSPGRSPSAGPGASEPPGSPQVSTQDAADAIFERLRRASRGSPWESPP